MPSYKAPLEDVGFLLNDVFQFDNYNNLPGFADASPDVREAILDEAAKLAEQVLQPLNRSGDLEGCVRHDDGRVTTPKGFKEAFKQVAEGGWLGLSAPTEYGGQGLPVTLTQAVTEFQSSANMAFSMYGGLTMGATAALMVHGKLEQKQMFVPKMVAGEWTGTMNLTEPQCGSVRFMVPVHSPVTILGRKIAFCSGLPCTSKAAVAPMVRPPYIENAMLAEHWNSLTVWLSATGRPCPPYSAGDDRPSQPPSVTCLNASLKPFGVVTLPSSWRTQPSRSPTRFSGCSTCSLSLAASSRIASRTSGDASAKPGRLL